MARELIVTLSSIPTRFDKLEPTLACLEEQSARIDRVAMYIPKRYRRFPDWDGRLPRVPDFVDIVRVEEDLGPATKVLYAAEEYRGRDVDLLMCDDDRRYKPDWAEVFVAARAAFPDYALCTAGFEADRYRQSEMRDRLMPRARYRWRLTDMPYQLKRFWDWTFPGGPRELLEEPPRKRFKASGFVDCFEGLGGVLVKPGWFDHFAYDIPPVIWAVDDVWLSGHLARRGIPIWVIGQEFDAPHTPTGYTTALYRAEIEGACRDEANQAAIAYFRDTYGLWP